MTLTARIARGQADLDWRSRPDHDRVGDDPDLQWRRIADVDQDDEPRRPRWLDRAAKDLTGTVRG